MSMLHYALLPKEHLTWIGRLSVCSVRFEMDVVGDKGVLHYQGRRIEGAANWEIR